MRIVIVDTTVHGTEIGGGHLYLPPLMKGLIEKGHDVHLVVKDEPNEKINSLIKASGVTVHKKPWQKNGLVEITAPLFADWVNEMKPDVYFISASGDIGWVALPLLDPSIAAITVGHTDSETFYLPARHYHSFLTKAIGVSHEVCDHYHTDCKIPSERIDWIPYGVITSETPPDISDNGILEMVYVGRVVEEQKRISDLIKVATILSAKNINFKLTIVGDGPDMPKVRSILEREITGGKVVLTGWIANPEIIEILRRSEVFVLTSAYEGFCIALTEAMANGCCPVVTDIRSGNKYLVKDSFNGFITKVGDTARFAMRLEELAEDNDKLSRMRMQAWNAGKQFSISKMTDDYEKCFLSAAELAKKSLRKKDPAFQLMSTCRSKYPRWIRNIKMAVKGN